MKRVSFPGEASFSMGQLIVQGDNLFSKGSANFPGDSKFSKEGQ
jgi:hypothetical protein